MLFRYVLHESRASPADLVSDWQGDRGLCRQQWLDQVHDSFFIHEDPDLWENGGCRTSLCDVSPPHVVLLLSCVVLSGVVICREAI